MDIVYAERAAADQRALKLAPDVHQRWLACHSTHRFWGFPSKELILCQFMFGRPSIINRFFCNSVELVVGEGLQTCWFDIDGQKTIVGQDPVELGKGCFLFHAGFGSLHTYLLKGKTVHRFSMLYRTEENPNRRTDGKLYLLERDAFNQMLHLNNKAD